MITLPTPIAKPGGGTITELPKFWFDYEEWSQCRYLAPPMKHPLLLFAGNGSTVDRGFTIPAYNAGWTGEDAVNRILAAAASGELAACL